MSGIYRKSFVSSSNSSKKKATQFKKGGKAWNKTAQRAPSTPVLTESHSAPSTITRLDSMVAMDVLTASELSSSSYPSSFSSSPLPYTLRPKPVTEKCNELQHTNENIIVNMGKMTELINHVHGFTCENARAKAEIVNRIGLCVSVSVKCSTCRLDVKPHQMSHTVKKDSGHHAGALNEMAVIPAVKTKMGLTDIHTVLACLDIKAPSLTVLQRKFNSLCDKMSDLNERQMIANQQYLKKITSLLPEKTAAIHTQFDVSYSRRPQGGSEKAEQSFGVIIDHSTCQKLPVAAAIANKHCKLRDCNHTGAKCTKTYCSDKSIASSERSLLHDTLDSVKDAGHITINSVTTDASTQLSKALRDFNTENHTNISHYKCFIHRVRTLEKHVRNLTLKSIPSTYDKRAYRQKLSQCVRARIRMELRNSRALKKSDHEFTRSSAAAIKIIACCLAGDHHSCRENSLVCKGHLRTYTTTSLPYGVHLELNRNDLDTVQNEINKIFDEEGLKSMCKLFNTNMCESLHSQVYRLAPKSISWSRNFPGLCHSAVHSATLGSSKSTIQLAEAAGIKVSQNSMLYVQLQSKDRLSKYHSKRKTTAEFKQRRYYLRKRKSYRSLFTNSLYSVEKAGSSTAQEHNYGLSS